MKKLTAIIIIAVAVITAAICFSRQMDSNLHTVKASYTYFEDSIEVSGMVLRDEDVYDKDPGTVFESDKKEGERVPTGSKIGTIYGKDASKAVINKIAEINSRISEIQKQEVGLETVYDDVSKVQDQMVIMVSNLTTAAQNMDGQGISSYKYEIDRLLDNKLVLDGKMDNPTDELTELESRRDEMEADLSKTDVICRSSGILTNVIDGYEADIGVDMIDSFTPESVDAWLAYKANPPKNTYCKVISNSEWYYTFNITVNQLDNLKFGDNAYIKTTSESTDLIPVSVYKISDKSKDGRVTVTVACTHDVDAVFTNRKLDLIFIKKVYEGYKVPKTAVHVKNDAVGVYALMGGIVEFRPINIVYSGEDYIMISNVYDKDTNRIRMYDEIITSTDKVKEGMLFT